MLDIDQMDERQLCETLASLKLDTGGEPEILRKRLANFTKDYRARNYSRFIREYEQSGGKPVQYFDYYIVVDMECTCEDKVYDYMHEIIEFPAALVDAKSMKVVDSFHSYVKPILHKQLDAFVVELTGVTQEMVDGAPTFLSCMDNFRRWMFGKGLGTKYSYAFVTDGPWDIAKFVQCQCVLSGLKGPPHDFRYWINLRRTFYSFFQNRPTPGDWVNSKSLVGSKFLNLNDMLSALNMKFVGREHCGKDDTANIASILIKLLEMGADPRINERLVLREHAIKINAERDQMNQNRNVEQDRLLREMGVIKDVKVVDTDSPSRVCSPLPLSAYEMEEAERRVWRDNLPYVLLPLMNSEFFNDEYLHCPTCEQ